MLLVGLFAGLIAYRSLPPTLEFGPGATLETEMEPRPGPAADPYAESRRSRAILEAQEAAPPSYWRSHGSGGSTASAAFVRVIDGDTFVYAGIRIRIADIDTPEVHGRCPFEIALAARATERMKALLAQGNFELHPLASGRDEDRYGRKLRVVTRGGRSLGDVLVTEGLARTWTGRREPWCG
jgi:endonuclease YncB( thermonuclease family)